MSSDFPKVFIAGHRDLVGNALVRFCRKARQNYQLLLRSHWDLDLLDQAKPRTFLEKERPDLLSWSPRK